LEQGAGNGCWTGVINYGAMGNVIRSGSATAGTNGGHDSAAGCGADTASFALGHPEKLKDFADRAFHEMTLDAKTLISAFYGNGPKLSFLDECGGGSREALTEMQRFPEDYDAVAASGLDGHSTHHSLGQLWVWQVAHKDEASYIPPAKYPAIHQAALEACDAQDGLKDGVISDPMHCKFDPVVLACKGRRCRKLPDRAASGGGP
jgi:feruloyl esterase